MAAPDGQEERTAFYEEAALDRDTDALLIDDDVEPVRIGSCDVCGETKAIVWHGVAYGIDTHACASCVYDVRDICRDCDRHVDECQCGATS